MVVAVHLSETGRVVRKECCAHFILLATALLTSGFAVAALAPPNAEAAVAVLVWPADRVGTAVEGVTAAAAAAEEETEAAAAVRLRAQSSGGGKKK